MFVAKRDDRWIGMAVGSRTGEDSDAHLYGMWVDPTWRGAGRAVGGGRPEVGAVLGRALGAPGVTEINDGAAGFYEQLGFADTGERHPLREGSLLTCRVLRREP
jgi:ribosomal protein S18 acetylase RimI-like enzyme